MSYTKTNWVNGQTPINPNNLNKIEQGIEDAQNVDEVSISSSEPTGNEKVWIKRSKNKFDWLGLLAELGISLPYTFNVAGVTFTLQKDGGIHAEGTSTNMIQTYLKGSYQNTKPYATLNNLENVTASGSSMNWSKGTIVSFTSYDGTTRRSINFNDSYSFTEFPITGISVNLNKNATVNETIYLQIEEGTEATEYEPYMDTEIYMKENGNFKEISSVAVSHVAPNAGEKLWVKTNKNLFDKDNPIYVDGLGLNDTGYFSRGDARTIVVPVPQNTEDITLSFTKSWTGSGYFAFGNEIPTSVSSTHATRLAYTNTNVRKNKTNNTKQQL